MSFESRLIGKEMRRVKEDVVGEINWYEGKIKEIEQKRKKGKTVEKEEYPWMNMIIYGSPGTGKTTIAKFVARMLYAKGVLPSDRVHSIQAGDLVKSYVGGVQQRLREEAEKAYGGVLIVDELQI